MGGCVGTPAGGRRNSGSNSGLSDSSLSPVTKNKPLKVDKVRWKSDIPLTEGQLISKRDEFWDTAPAFEGKTEIWVALKAAVDATFKDDVPLAQAILDGAGISLPSGKPSIGISVWITSRYNIILGGLGECYDEWGTRYTIPVYCLSNPLNLVTEADRDSPAEFSEPILSTASASVERLRAGEDVKVKVRLSTTGEDVRLVLNTMETIGMAKKKLQDQEGIQDPSTQRWYFGGKLLGKTSSLF